LLAISWRDAARVCIAPSIARVVLPMSQEQWTRVDEYFSRLLVAGDAALDAALVASQAAGLPAINVAPNQGKFLALLAQMQGARRILEVGTLGGYSTIWLARALASGGRLITLELDPHHAEVARKNLERAGVSASVEIRVGRALDTLSAQLQTQTQTVLTAQAKVGATYARVDATKSQNTTNASTMQQNLSNVEDADLTQVLMNLQAQQMTYQAALAAAAKAIQPSLAAFLQ
jgi:flagellin-like hook-associated protein FlgL